MKKFLITTIFIISFSTAFCAVKAVSDTISARRAFVEMPSKVLDLIAKDTRLDMLDFFDADSVWQAKNELEGISCLETVTPTYLKVKITPVSTMQIKILKDKKGNDLVMTIYTTGAEGDSKDSDVKFYSPSMTELKSADYLKMPMLKDFFDIPRGSLTSMKEIEALVPFYTVEFKASANDDNLEAVFTPGDFMTLEDQKLVNLFLKPDIKYIWDGKKFSLKK